jgi:sulfatase-like protein
LDYLSKEGTIFKNVLVPLPSTSPSHASLLTSLHPLRHHVAINLTALSDDVNTIAETLYNSGYYTMGAIAVEHLKKKYGFNQGFVVFSDQWNEPGAENNSLYRGAGSVNKDLYKMLDIYTKREAAEPFFLFVHYFDVHRPYIKPDQDFTVDEPAEKTISWEGENLSDLVDSYDSGIRYVDKHIKELYAHLETLGLTDNLIICVTSDHGEQLGEHGYTGGHADIYRETVRVPLIFSGAGVKRAVVERNVSSMDIAVSILALVGLELPGPVEGRNLFEVTDDQDGGIRRLLIAGCPHKTRSLGVVEGDDWYLRNLDYIYRDVITENIAGINEEKVDKEAINIPPDDSGTYLLHLPDDEMMTPGFITVDIRLKDDSSPANVSINLAPRLSYFKNPISFTSAIRIHYPVIRGMDRTGINISPEDRVKEVLYRFRTIEEFDSYLLEVKRPYRRIVTDLYKGLLTDRKNTTRNELYNISADPSMVQNLVELPGYRDKAKQLCTETDELFFKTKVIGPVDSKYSRQEIDALRSLGYIQ